ncbi:MAG TPA: hypothetical protein VHM31_00215, partial [Polyangia bacterium]|nr:hypothetical protein [Polyangia bacterium]
GGHAGGNVGGAGGAAQTGDFSFSTGTTTALSLPPGGQQTIAITINRDAATPTFTSSIMFTLTGTGVTGTFTPNPATLNSTSLSLTVASTATAGASTVHITGTAAGKTHTVDLPLTVTAPNTTLLVDFDASDNNADPTDTTATPSNSDTLFAALLQGENIGFNTFVVPSGGAGSPNTPTTQDLAAYSTVVWYNGANDAGSPNSTLSPSQEAIVEAWLDTGHKTMLVFSQQMFYALGTHQWTTPETNKFLSDYIGAQGDSVDKLQNMTYNTTGVASTPFAGDVFQVINGVPDGFTTTSDAVNPKDGTDALVTAMIDPDGNGTQALPVVVGRKNVGTAGTSTVVYVGIPVEYIQMTINNNTAAQFFHAVLQYAGLK